MVLGKIFLFKAKKGRKLRKAVVFNKTIFQQDKTNSQKCVNINSQKLLGNLTTREMLWMVVNLLSWELMLWVEKKSNLSPTKGTPYLSWLPLMSINLFFFIPLSLIITSIIFLYWIHSASSCLELVLFLFLASAILSSMNSNLPKDIHPSKFEQRKGT